MPPSRRVLAAVESEEDPQVRAAHILADAINNAVDRFGPALDTAASFGHRLDALCNFLRRKGPWILASIPTVLVAIGAITPEAGKGIHRILAAFGFS